MKRKRGRKQTLEKRNETKILLYIIDADWYCFYQCCGSGSGAGSTGFTFFEPPGSRSGSISQRQELAVTDLLYNVMNPEHMSLVIEI